MGIPGEEHLIDSTDFLSLEDLPRRVVFVGGGFVSFEFAHIEARAGASPVIIDHGPCPLHGVDPDLVELLVTRGAEVGIDVRRDTDLTSIERSGSTYLVAVETAGTRSAIETDLVVHGAGRIPQLSKLGLNAANIA